LLTYFFNSCMGQTLLTRMDGVHSPFAFTKLGGRNRLDVGDNLPRLGVSLILLLILIAGTLEPLILHCYHFILELLSLTVASSRLQFHLLPKYVVRQFLYSVGEIFHVKGVNLGASEFAPVLCRVCQF
jgi:hypothetical protein